MPSPSFSFYHAGSTESTGDQLSLGNPLEFGAVHGGIPSDIQSFDLWNDRNADIGSDTAISPTLYVRSSPDDISPMLSGTAMNDYTSFIEMRSCQARNAIADAQTEWTKVSLTDGLVLGNMPSNSSRTIEVRINAPPDAGSMTLKSFSFRVTF